MEIWESQSAQLTFVSMSNAILPLVLQYHLFLNTLISLFRVSIVACKPINVPATVKQAKQPSTTISCHSQEETTLLIRGNTNGQSHTTTEIQARRHAVTWHASPEEHKSLQDLFVKQHINTVQIPQEQTSLYKLSLSVVL